MTRLEYAIAFAFASLGYAILLFALFSGWFPDILPGWVTVVTVAFVVGMIYIFTHRAKLKIYKVSQSRRGN